MRRPLLSLGLIVLLASPVAGQTPAEPVFQKVTAIVTTNAPIYVVPRPGPTLGPIRTAAVGTVLVVLNEKDDWLQIEFNDPQFGRRVGWVEKKLVRIEDPALRPIDLSVPADPTRPRDAPPSSGTATPPPDRAQTAEATDGVTRRGFTILVNLGLGVQHVAGLPAEAGLSGANLGLGGFVTKDLALLGRFSGTTVNRSGPFGSFGVVSGVFGATMQYWPSDRVNVEGGVGFGVWADSFEAEGGLGLILGANGVVFNRGKHYLQVGVEYAPVFANSLTMHNVGVTFGYQYHR